MDRPTEPTATEPSPPADRPRTLWRVAWWQGFGYPERTRRVRKVRTFADVRAAVRMATKSLAWPPGHHQLIGVWRAEGIEWEAVTVRDLEADLAGPEPDDPGPEDPNDGVD